MEYQDPNLKICLSLFVWKENILYKQHILQCFAQADFDECTEGGKKCGENTDCINTDGGHHCVCQVGFGGDPCKILFGNDFML